MINSVACRECNVVSNLSVLYGPVYVKDQPNANICTDISVDITNNRLLQYYRYCSNFAHTAFSIK